MNDKYRRKPNPLEQATLIAYIAKYTTSKEDFFHKLCDLDFENASMPYSTGERDKRMEILGEAYFSSIKRFIELTDTTKNLSDAEFLKEIYTYVTSNVEHMVPNEFFKQQGFNNIHDVITNLHKDTEKIGGLINLIKNPIIVNKEEEP